MTPVLKLRRRRRRKRIREEDTKTGQETKGGREKKESQTDRKEKCHKEERGSWAGGDMMNSTKSEIRDDWDDGGEGQIDKSKAWQKKDCGWEEWMMFDEGGYERESQEWGHELRERNEIRENVIIALSTSLTVLMTLTFWKAKPENSKRLPLAQGRHRQSHCRCCGPGCWLCPAARSPASGWEAAKRKGAGGKRKSNGHVRLGTQEFKCEKAGQRLKRKEKILCPLC